tara:strand:- start:170 stop:604 length:435 start_codon:yes stop_codon:yes gene_type:complete
MEKWLYHYNLKMKIIKVNGNSMEPILRNKDYVLGVKFNKKQLRYCNVVAFNYNSKLMVKRLIGLPRDQVKIDGEDIWINNDFKLPMNFSQFKSKESIEIITDHNSISVLGDNSNNSLDSRKIGSIPIKDIKFKIVFNFNTFRVI